MIRFIDREAEIEMLKKAAESEDAQLVVLYGRRRVGKTRLILEFLKDKRAVFYMAEDVSKSIQIRELKEKIAEFFDDDFLRSVEIREWNELFEYLKKVIPRDERIYLVIDEFSYIVKNSPEIVTALQRFWDTFASETKIFILLSGSLLGLMSDKLLAYSSPLYGRRTRDIFLTPLNFRHSADFLHMDFEEKIRVYMAIGGVPEYLIRASNYRDSLEFFNKEFFSRYGYFYRELYFLLSQEFREIKTYFAILNAIAYGNTRAVKIANFVGIRTREIYPYLENLIRLGLLRRELPMPASKRSGIYLINDPFVDFWFNFVYDHRAEIERDEFKVNEEELKRYFGKRFEIFVRDEIFSLFFKNFKVGRWWHRDEEIDIVAIKDATNEIIFGECKWSDNVDAERILRSLRERARKVVWKNDERKERYVIFAKSFRRKAENCRCIDLEDIRRMMGA